MVRKGTLASNHISHAAFSVDAKTNSVKTRRTKYKQKLARTQTRRQCTLKLNFIKAGDNTEK